MSNDDARYAASAIMLEFPLGLDFNPPWSTPNDLPRQGFRPVLVHGVWAAPEGLPAGMLRLENVLFPTDSADTSPSHLLAGSPGRERRHRVLDSAEEVSLAPLCCQMGRKDAG